ncbi:MAG: hypothetical protein PHN56_01680 [Candidatus Nanoarchaeia archaeon]|nr:hypothetical protein [Candidatus Nanoarchaeia archaeon]
MNLNELKEKSANIRHEIVKNINEFKKLEKSRNEINVLVKDSKQKREECVAEVKKILKELSDLNVEKKASNFKDIKSLISLINKKEWFFQINALPIKKEEQILKEIKELKKELNEAQKENQVVIKIRSLVKSLELKRKDHNEFHQAVIENAEKSNEFSNSMNAVQKKIKELKKEGRIVSKELDDAIVDYKKNKNFKVKNFKENKEKIEKIIQEKENQAWDKLKDKKKLTTEDLLAFQNN